MIAVFSIINLIRFASSVDIARFQFQNICHRALARGREAFAGNAMEPIIDSPQAK
jgi:hypothetical protein